MNDARGSDRKKGAGLMPFLLRVIKGAVVGVGAILPGISGGVLSVVFGIYRPLMELMAHPIKQFRRKLWYFLPIGIGFVLGILGLARVVDWLFRESPVPAVWLFAGLVVGTLPALWHEAGQKGRGGKDYAALAIGAAFTGAWMYFMTSVEGGAAIDVGQSFGVWVMCGVLWGLGLVVPGLSPSSIFIFLNVYQPMTAGIGALDMSVVVPMALGLLLAVGLLARVMGWLLERCYSVLLHAIFGLVIVSTVGILPIGQSIADAAHIALYAACFIIGAAVALVMDAMHKRMEERGEVD